MDQLEFDGVTRQSSDVAHRELAHNVVAVSFDPRFAEKSLHMIFSVQPLGSLCNKIAESSFFEKLSSTPKAFANFSPGVGAQRQPWDIIQHATKP